MLSVVAITVDRPMAERGFAAADARSGDGAITISSTFQFVWRRRLRPSSPKNSAVSVGGGGGGVTEKPLAGCAATELS